MLDLQVWDQLLSRYVDDRGRVDYQSWQGESLTSLEDWIRSLEQITFPSDPDAQLALWINLYNALTICQVLQRYPMTSIRPQILGVSNWLSFLCFFERKIFQNSGQRYSLNAIEHGVLRSQFQEYRIHFALVCASIGCPLLRNHAYLPERVRHQLEEDTHRFINNSDKVRYDPDQEILYCSKIFKWYHKDFLRVSPSIQDLISKYLQPGANGRYPSPSISATTPIQYLHYDWSLNQRTSS